MRAAEPGARREPPLPLPAPRGRCRDGRRRSPLRALRGTSRAPARRPTVRGVSAASSRSGGASLPRLRAKASCARSRSRRARCSSSSGPSSAAASSFRAARGRTGLVLGLRGGQLTPGAVRGIGGQRGGSLEERGCGGETAARLRAVGRALELGGDVLVRCERGLGAVPRAAIGIDLGIGRCRQSLMRTPPLFGRRRAVDRRAQEGVAKGHPGAERRAGPPLPQAPPPRAEIEALGRPPQQRRIADRLGRGDEQQPLALGGQAFHPLPEALLDPARQRQRGRQREAACQLRRRQPVRQARAARADSRASRR